MGFCYSTRAVVRARAARARAADACRASRRLRFRSLLSRGHASVSGSSDSDGPVIVAALSGASLCDACVAAKAGIAETDVRAALARVAATVTITTEFGRCERCMRADLLSRLG